MDISSISIETVLKSYFANGGMNDSGWSLEGNDPANLVVPQTVLSSFIKIMHKSESNAPKKKRPSIKMSSSDEAGKLFKFLQAKSLENDCHEQEDGNILTNPIPQHLRLEESKARQKAFEVLSGSVILSLVKDMLEEALKRKDSDWESLVVGAQALLSSSISDIQAEVNSNILGAKDLRLKCREKALEKVGQKDEDLKNDE